MRIMCGFYRIERLFLVRKRPRSIAALGDLKFSSQIDALVRKAYSILFFILRNIKCFDEEILLRLCKSYVLPLLNYCSPVWSPHLKKDILKIEKV